MRKGDLWKLLVGVFVCLALGGNAADNKPYKTKTIKDISYLTEPTDDEYRKEISKLDLYLPEGKKEFPTLVYFHGGGLTGGRRGGPRQLVALGIAVVGVEYRLYPKCKHPEYIEDCAAATAWVFKNIAKYGGDPSKIFIAGYSAGGYLTGMLAMDKKYLAAQGVDADKLAGALFQSGHTITHFTVRKQFGYGVQQGICDENSPMYHIRKTPFPIILQCGDNDYPSRQEENRLFESMMIRYAKQPRDRIRYCEYEGTHGTLSSNKYFKKDTANFILKHSGMPCEEIQGQPEESPVGYFRKYDENYYLTVANKGVGVLVVDGKEIKADENNTYKLAEKPLNGKLTIVNQLPIVEVAEVKNYALKDGEASAIKFANGVKVWREKDNLNVSLVRKNAKIKTPQDGKYYSADGMEIFVDRTPLRNIDKKETGSPKTSVDVKQFLFSVKPDSKGKVMAVVHSSAGGSDITLKSKVKVNTEIKEGGYTMLVTIPLAEISALNKENVIGLNVQVNDYESGKKKEEDLSGAKKLSYAERQHYPLFRFE